MLNNLRSMLTGDKSQCNVEKLFHPPSFSNQLLRKMLFFFSCIRTARLLCRAARAITSRPAIYGGTRLSDSGRGTKNYAYPANKTFEPTRSGKKSHASDLSSVFKVCIEKKKLLSNQYKSNPRLTHPTDGKVKLRSSERKISRHKKTAAKVGRASN